MTYTTASEGSAWWAGEGEGVASNVADALSGLGDLERGITRSLHGTAAPAEFYNVMRRMASIAPKLGVSVSALRGPCPMPSDSTVELLEGGSAPKLGVLASRIWRTMLHALRQHC